MKLGTNDIGSVYLGTNAVNAVYLGTNLVWQNAPVATAATGVGQTSFTANWNAYTGAVYYLLDVSTSSSFTTFVYENQVTTSTSYVVIGLQPNTTYYYRVRASTEYDADAQAFFDRVTTAGGTLSTTEQDAVNTLVVQMKNDGIWTKMKAIYPMVGASAAACAQNLKSSSFTGSFTSGWTFASTGATPNGTNAYMNTGLIPSTALASINNVHLSMYSRTQNSSVSGHNMGVDQSLSNNLNLSQYFASVSVKLFMNGGYPNNSAEFNETNTLGLAIGSATSSTVRKLHFNGTLLNTDTNTQAGALPNVSLYVGSGRNSASPNAANYFTPHENSFTSIGDGLTDTEASNFYTAVQAFQTTLSRQV